MVAHIRKRGPRRSPHRTGRLTPDLVLERDPRRQTLCGAEPTDRDIRHHEARYRFNRERVDLCAACRGEAS